MCPAFPLVSLIKDLEKAALSSSEISLPGAQLRTIPLHLISRFYNKTLTRLQLIHSNLFIFSQIKTTLIVVPQFMLIQLMWCESIFYYENPLSPALVYSSSIKNSNGTETCQTKCRARQDCYSLKYIIV